MKRQTITFQKESISSLTDMKNDIRQKMSDSAASYILSIHHLSNTGFNWNSDENLSSAAKKVGLDLNQLRESVDVHEEEIIKQIKQNQVDQLNAGHHGVPLTVIGEKYFFGQDQFEKIMETLKENGLKER